MSSSNNFTRSLLALSLALTPLVAKAQLLDTITGFTPNLAVSNSTGAPGRNIAGGLQNISYSVPFGYIPAQGVDTPISSVGFLGYISARDFDAGFRPTYRIAVGQQAGMFSNPVVASFFDPALTSITEVSRFQGSNWVQVAVSLTFSPAPDLKASAGSETLVALEAGFFGLDPTGALFATERGLPAFHAHGTIFKQNITTASQGRYFTASDLGDYVMMRVNSSGSSAPEPGSLFLLLLGGGVFGVYKRRS